MMQVKNTESNLIPTILLVDDDEQFLASLFRAFRSLGYRLLKATSGMEALAIIEMEEVDLVISDLRMPMMDGSKLFAEIEKRNPDIVKILLTGHNDTDSTMTAVNEGNIYKYFHKPYDDQALKLAVQAGLEEKFLAQKQQYLLDFLKNKNQELHDKNSSLEENVINRSMQLLTSERIAIFSQMISSLSNEFRNPLALIVARLDMLQDTVQQIDDPTLKQTLDAHITAIEKGASNFQDIINGMRDFSLEAEESNEFVMPVSELIEEALVFVNYFINKYEIDLRITFAPEVAFVSCTPKKITQAIINVMFNAIDAVHDLPEPWITVEVEADDKTVFIAIEDSGPEVPVSVAKRAMTPFFTTRMDEDRIGLGLPIARAAVEACGGQLYFNFKCDHTCFIIELPLHKP